MRMCSMFQRFIVLMAVLTLSLSFVTFARQKPVQTKVAETGATQDANAVRLEAEAAAQLAASNDFRGSSKFLWLSSGAASPPLGLCIGISIGFFVDPFKPVTTGSFGAVGCSGGKLIIPGITIGGITGITLPFIISAYHSPIVPAEKLLGKSAEYVKSYSDAYKAKVRSLRVESVAAGTAIGIGLSVIGCLMMIPTQL